MSVEGDHPTTEQVIQQIKASLRHYQSIPGELTTELGLDKSLVSIANVAEMLSQYAEAHSELKHERNRFEVASKVTGLVLGNTIGFDEVAKRALKAAVDFLSTNGRKRQVFGTLQRLDRDSNELVDIAGVGYEAGREDVRVRLGDGVTGLVAQKGETLLIGDLTSDEWKDIYVDVMEENMRAELAVPLLREKEVWGVLNVESPEINAFDKNDRLLLEMIGDQILIALRNAEAHVEIEHERDRFEVASKVTGLVLGNTIGFDKVAKRALKAAVDFLSTNGRKRQVFGTLQRLDRGSNELVDIAGVGYEAGREDVRVRLGDGVTGLVAQKGETLLIGDLTSDEWKDIYVDVMEENMRAELAVPLLREKEVWGVLNVESPEVNAFGEDDRLLLEMIGDQILIALRNAEAHVELEHERDRFEVASKVTGLVLGNTVGFEEEAKRALEVAVDFLSTNERQVYGTLQRLDESTNQLLDIAGVGYEAGQEDVPVRLGEGVTGRVAQKGEALLINDLTDKEWKDVYVDVMAGDMRSELAVPLIRDDKIWGVLNVESPEPDAFDENDSLMLKTIGDQILIALRNEEAHEQMNLKEKLDRELKEAKLMQESITPKSLPNFKGFDFGAYTLPARSVGGDIYDFIRLDRDSIGILIGDVVDKGVPASIFMAITKGLVRALATPELSPREVLLKVNQHLYEMNTADMFVTLIYGVLSRRNRTFTYAQGGHDIPLVIDKMGDWMQLPNETGQALGFWPSSEVEIYEHTVSFPNGGTVLMYTDGVADAINAQGESFYVDRIKDFDSKKF